MTRHRWGQLGKAFLISAAGLSLVVGWTLIEIGKAVTLPARSVR